MHRIGTSERPDLPLAVVVGAGALGMAVARRLALSHRILLADIDTDAAQERAARLRSEGCDAVATTCDVTSAASVAGLAGTVQAAGGLGTLAYVAGLSPSAAGFEAIVDVNLIGVARVCEALRPLARQGSAAVIISSMAAHMIAPEPEVAAILADVGAPGLPGRLAAMLGEKAEGGIAYSLSKWGINRFVRRQARAWGERGARIVSLSPGMIATPFGAVEFEKSPQKRGLYELSPIRRECTMLEIADALEFLASPRAAFINGTDLLVDGGLSAAVKER